MNVRTPSLLLLTFAVACGGTAKDPLSAELDLPERPDAKISVTPALEVSSLFAEGLADRIVLEEITINLAEVRLLGADPTIPAGGLELLGEDRIVRADEGARAAMELAFPDQYLGDEDLAVYLRIARNIDLDDSSLVIRGRLYSSPVTGGSAALTASGDDEATDPDIDPADEPEPTDPTADTCATDPDIDPADCPEVAMMHRSLVTRASYNRFISFELRDDGAADLVAQLAEQSLDVVVGIPAARWFTPDVVDGLETALVEEIRLDNMRARDPSSDAQGDRVIVEARDSRTEAAANRCRDRLGCNEDEIFLTDEREGLTARR